MTGIPVWILGRHLTTASLTQQLIASDGTFTPGSSWSLLGQLDEIDVETTNELENITPMDVRQNNYVPVSTESTFTLTEILKSNGVNILANAAVAGDYWYVVLTRGGQSWGFYGVVESYNEGLRRRKTTGRLVLKMLNPGIANPAYG